MKAISDAWQFLMAAKEKRILEDMQFSSEDVEFISLSYGMKKDEGAPCLATLTVFDQRVYLLCITRIFPGDKPSFILCSTKVDNEGELKPVEIRARNDVLHFDKGRLPWSITEVLEEALARKGEECSV